MKAIVLKKPYELELMDIEKPKLKRNEVLIKIKSNGICTNDLRDYKGSNYTYPRIGGHEFSGQIVEMDENVPTSLFSIGDHVVKYIIPSCGVCKYCKNNRENLCIHSATSEVFINHNGISGFKGMAEYLAVDYKLLYKYPEGFPFEISAFTEPLACAINSVERPNLYFGQDVVVMGAGVMGLLHVLLLKNKGVRIIVSEPSEERRKLAETLGAHFTINPLEGNPVEALKEITNGHLADVVFNTTESPKVIEQALQFTGIGGQTFLFSSIHPNEPVKTNMGEIHSLEKVITGTVSPTIKTYNQAVDLLSKNIIDVKPLIDKVFSYVDFQEAYDHALDPSTYKTIINFE